jgi:hypothetical protein
MEIPYTNDEEGSRTYQVPIDAANEDWIRSSRLQKRADEGDEEARRELEVLFDTLVITAKELNNSYPVTPKKYKR